MKVSPARTVSAARRQELLFFVVKVFEFLHPGEPPLAMNWYIQAICHTLMQVHQGEINRVVINVPPRHLKSITTSVAFVAWMLGRHPSMNIMVASYSQDLARHHSNLTRAVMESDWYKNDFPNTRISKRGSRALELETTAGGGRKAVTVGGSGTGFGADMIIIDDCMKGDEARSPVARETVRSWYENTLLSRLNNKATDPIVSIQQRLHQDDLPGYMLEKGFAHLNLPAIAEKEERIAIGPDRYHLRLVGELLNPEREDRATLERLRREFGPVVFVAQYQQDPVTPEGNMIRLEWFGTYNEAPERHQFLKVVQSWDTGFTDEPSSDYSVCTTWGFERDACKWYLLDVFRQRLTYPDLRRAVLQLKRRYQPDGVLMERAGAGISLYDDLKVSGDLYLKMINPVGSKEDRFNGCLGEVEAGQFVLPAQAPWLDAFKAELKAFPLGKKDDQVDSFSQFVRFQLIRWKWVLTERMADGRAKDLVRLRNRPWGPIVK